MSIIGERTRRFAANSIYPSFFLGLLGLGLAQAWIAQMGGAWWLHAFLAIPGVALSGLALYRARLHWLAGIADVPWQPAGRRPSFGIHDFAWHLLLFGMGVLIAYSAGSTFLLGIVATLLYLVPWTRIPVCRARFNAASLSMLAGAAAVLAFHGKPVYPLHYAFAAWIVLFSPMMMLLLVMGVLPAGYRLRELPR